MCQLLALNSNAPVAATFSFTGLSARGGATDHHVDGWGMAFHDGDAPRVFHDAGRACDAPLATFLRRRCTAAPHRREPAPVLAAAAAAGGRSRPVQDAAGRWPEPAAADADRPSFIFVGMSAVADDEAGCNVQPQTRVHMITVSQHHHDGTACGPAARGPEAHALLRRLGIETGPWALHLRPVSSTPLLTYARELLALQRRYGTARTDRLRWPQRDPRGRGIRPEAEPAEIHAHDDVEVRVVLAGCARIAVAAGAAGGWTRICCEAGNWIALPAGLPHALAQPHAEPEEVLRLHAGPRGAGRQRCDAGVPPALLDAIPLARLA